MREFKIPALSVIYEDNHLLVVNKPAGMLVQGDKTGDECLIDLAKKYIKEKYNKPGDVFLGLAHRLDRPVSGVVLLARTSKALARITADFRERKVKKLYWAITPVKPSVDQGRLVNWLIKDQRKNIVKSYKKEKSGALRAELTFEVKARVGSNYLLEINLETGRFHQIRVQLAGMGCPIYGDIKYGSKVKNTNGKIFLHARKLSLIHPVKKEEVVFLAPLPKESLWQNFGDI